MRIEKRIITQIAALAVFALLVTRCEFAPNEPEFDNPLNPDDSIFIPVATTITGGPADNEVVDDHTVTFLWTGNEGVVEYAYRLDASAWSDWSSSTSVTYSYLDEGNYTFEVKSRYNEAAEDETPESRSFEIDDVHGPALMFYPRKVEITKDSVFGIEIIAEEVVSLTGVKIVVDFDPSYLQVQEITVYEDGGAFFRTNGGSVISFYDYDNGAGRVSIDCGVATGDPPGVEGTGAIARVEFQAVQAGSTEVTFDTATEMRTPDNEDIPLSEVVKGIVVIE